MRMAGVPFGVALEALRDHVAAILALKRRSFSDIIADRSTPRTPASDAERDLVARATNGWARYLPWRPECFPRALVARAMLERRGREAVLHYGSRRRHGELEAHVWVSSGGRPVVGHRNAHEFVELARFPDAQDGAP